MFFLKDLPTCEMISGYGDYFEEGQSKEISETLAFFRDASLRMRRVDAYFTANGLSWLKFLILIVIDREPDRDWLQYSEIVDRLDVSKPVISRTIRSLLDEGILEETGSDTDKRIKRYHLTTEGTDTFHSLLKGYFSTLTQKA